VSRSSPADLAVAFRSVPRRVRDALEGCEDATTWSGHSRIETALREAADLVGATSDPFELADVIDRRRAADWDDRDLVRLETLALQIGALVREAEALRDESPSD
jgi:hypothetical protein